MKKVLLFLIVFLLTNTLLKAQKLDVPANQHVTFSLSQDDDYTKGKRLRTTAKIMRWTSGALVLVGLTNMLAGAGYNGDGDPDKKANRGATFLGIGVATWVVSIPINIKGKRLMKMAQ